MRYCINPLTESFTSLTGTVPSTAPSLSAHTVDIMNFGINPYTTDFILLSPIVAVFVRHQQNLKMLVVVAFGCVLASGLLLFVGDAWLDQQWLS